MFLDYSLCPGGAMMVCESVSEYDGNVPAPVMQPQGNVLETMSDPVMKLINKSKHLHEYLKELGATNLEPDSMEEAVGTLDTISQRATQFAEFLRMLIVKQSAVYNMMDINGRRWSTEPIVASAKVFIQNKNRIVQLGYDKFQASWNELSTVCGYDVRRMLSLYLNTLDGLPDYPIDMELLRDVFKSSYGEGFLDCFSTMHDMFTCPYDDVDRLLRLEQSRTTTMTVSDLLNDISWRVVDGAMGIKSIRDDNIEFGSTLICYLSRTLRMIKTKVYMLQCKFMEPDVTLDKELFHKCSRSMIAGIYDMFYISMIWMLSNAYRMREHIAIYNSCKNYVEDTLNAIKTGKIS